MTQYPYQPVPVPLPETSNTLGLVGFICSIVGLVTGGLLSPVGLVISLVALGRQPKGFAIAGTVLGLIGSCGILIAVIAFGAVIVAALAAAVGIAAVALVLSEPEKLEITADMANIAQAISAYERDNRYLPADLDVLDLESFLLTDPWGKRYEYHLQEDPPGYDLHSLGPDGTAGTADDVRLSTLDEVWSASRFGVEVDETDDGGTVRIMIGERALINATGDDESGTVSINLGDRTIEIVGDEDGGRVTVEPVTAEEPDVTAEETPASQPE